MLINTDHIKEGSTILVTQVRGSAGRPKRTKDTLAALGLGRISKRCKHKANGPLLGMIRAVSHLVSVDKLEE